MSEIKIKDNEVVIDPKVVGVDQHKRWGDDPNRRNNVEDHSKDYLMYPMLKLSSTSEKALRPMPTKDSRIYDVLQSAYRSFLFFPLEVYTIQPGDTMEIDTGWALYSYPAETYTLQVCMTPAYIRLGLACFTTCIDSILGTKFGKRISFAVHNFSTERAITIYPRDDVFELRMIPKQKFWISTAGVWNE